jgi:aspartate aminotransferase-like enzyme
MIYLTTGPVTIIPEVMTAFAELPLSHRSQEFKDMYARLTGKISDKLGVKETYILTGSGTLANEIMIGQIGTRKEHGLILSNGEFGERLINQANRQQLDFETLVLDKGSIFDLHQIAGILSVGAVKWLLFCHCESSSGIINPFDEIIELCRKYGCAVYVDCMSTFANRPLNLEYVAMGTASSGKAVGGIAGLALVFCNAPVNATQPSALSGSSACS